MGTVSVNSTTFTVYGPTGATATLDAAKTYLKAAIGAGPDAWNALATDDLKSKFIVAAFRYLERQVWAGAKTVAGQTEQWPRTGVVDAYDVAVDSASVPQVLIDAQYELAAIFAGDETVASAASTGSNIKRLKAGVEVEYFRATDVDSTATKLPQVVMEMVGMFLGGATGLVRSTVSGADCDESAFDYSGDSYPYDRSDPF